MAKCPYCLEDVKDGAKKCPHCQSDLTDENQQSKNVILILDKGLVTFGKYTLTLLGLFAIILYTALGFHIQDSVKEIDTSLKSVNDLYEKTRSTGLTINKEAIENQKEILKLKDDFVKIGNDFKAYIANKTTEVETLKSDVDKTRADSTRMLSEVSDIVKRARLAGDDVERIRSEIAITMRTGSTSASVQISTTDHRADVSVNPGRPNLWKKGTTLKVWFLDGDDDIRKEIMAVAGEWSKEANITFALGKNRQESDIRITLSGEGTWSFVGTQALSVPKSEPTMTLERLGLADRAARRASILHEFGHALGFLHEHQSPKANIQWNLAAMQASLHFTQEEIEAAFTKPYPPESLPCIRDFDPKSVMMLTIPKAFTSDGQGYPLSSELSPSDRECAKNMYPRA